MTAGIGRLVEMMTPDQRAEWHERSAIIQYDGNKTRDWAEYIAALTVLNIQLPQRDMTWISKEK
jgi:hypothetical protein